MGGSGSGSWYRWSSKTTTESQYKVDVRWMKKQGLLVPGTVGTLSWSCRGEESGSIGYRLESDRLMLHYRNRQNGGEWESIKQTIMLTWTFPNYGGGRIWFKCPRCCRKVAVLYGGKYFFCRHCHNLTYSSQQEARYDRLLRKANTIKERLCGKPGRDYPFPWKPKNMHWKTYWHLRKEAEQAENLGWVMIEQRFGNLF